MGKLCAVETPPEKVKSSTHTLLVVTTQQDDKITQVHSEAVDIGSALGVGLGGLMDSVLEKREARVVCQSPSLSLACYSNE